MKQKYLILKNDEEKVLIIKEFADVDKGMFSLLYEEKHPHKQIKSAIKKGKEALIATLRTPTMYPVGRYADRIAEEVINLYKSKEVDSKELFFDDVDLLAAVRDVPEPLDDDESELTEADDLLEDDTADSTYDDEIKDITQQIKIADVDSVDTVDE